MHRHESRQPGVGALDPNARLLPSLRVAFGQRLDRPHANERPRVRARELRVEAHVEHCVEIGGGVEIGQAWAAAQQAARGWIACWARCAACWAAGCAVCWEAAVQQAIQLGAATGGAGGRGLECPVREVVGGEVERRVDREHLTRCHDSVCLATGVAALR